MTAATLPVDAPPLVKYRAKVPRKNKQAPWPEDKRKRPPFRMTMEPEVLEAVSAESERQGNARSHLIERYVLEGLRRDGVNVDEIEEKIRIRLSSR